MPDPEDAIDEAYGAWLGGDYANMQSYRDVFKAGWTAREQETERLKQALSDIQFDLINCHEAAGRDACEHINDAIRIVNRTLKADGFSFSERESTCRCGRPLIHPGDDDPWCQGCNMSASTCDCAGAPV